MSKKIVHVTSAHKDGDVRIFHKECVSLAEAGFEVYHLVPNSVSRTEKGVKIVSFDFPVASRFKRMFFLVKEIYKRALELNADVYHLHDPELLRIALKLKAKGKQVIYDAHEDVPRDILTKYWIPLSLRKIVSRRFEKFETKIASKIDGVVAATPFIRDRFLKANKQTIDINNYPILDTTLSWVSYHEKKDENVCYLGVIVAKRGVVEVVEASEKTSFRFLLAGEYREAEIEGKLKSLPGWRNVDFLGFVGRDQVVEVYNKSKVGLVTLHPVVTFLDSLPVKMFEYMAAGIPVVASNFPLWKSIIEDGQCGLCVDPLNPDEIAKAIRYILDHPTEAAEMGQNGRRLVNEKYNWDREKRKLVAFYGSIK